MTESMVKYCDVKVLLSVFCFARAMTLCLLFFKMLSVIFYELFWLAKTLLKLDERDTRRHPHDRT